MAKFQPQKNQLECSVFYPSILYDKTILPYNKNYKTTSAVPKKQKAFQPTKNSHQQDLYSPYDIYGCQKKNAFLLHGDKDPNVLVVFTGIISFCVCYYHGPVTSGRGLNLIRWMLQLVGLTLLYMGTRSDVVSFGVISTVFLSHVIRGSGILMGVTKMMPRHW